MKKVVLKLELHDDKTKQKAMTVVSALPGVDSVAVDMKEEKLTVMGAIDTVTIVTKLRKFCRTEVVSVGPAKEPEKKDKPAAKPETEKQPLGYVPINHYYYAGNYRSIEENPNACVIC